MSEPRLAEINAIYQAWIRNETRQGVSQFVPELLAEVKRLREENQILAETPRDILEEFKALWKEYGLADDATLTSDAVELKERLREVVKKCAEENEAIKELNERLEHQLVRVGVTPDD